MRALIKSRITTNKFGITLIENLISILLLSILLVGLLAAFFISRLGSERAKHRLVAMNIIKDYMERELRLGYDGGSDGEGDYYVRVTSADPVSVIIDDRGTLLDDSDNLMGTITADPYYPDNVDGLAVGSVQYKIIGFVVTWTEDIFGQGAGPICSERAVAYVSYHSTS